MRRGRSWCVWIGDRYERVFSGRRGRLDACRVDLLAVLRGGFFGEPLSGMDAPYLMQAGSMTDDQIGQGALVPSIVVRGGE